MNLFKLASESFDISLVVSPDSTSTFFAPNLVVTIL